MVTESKSLDDWIPGMKKKLDYKETWGNVGWSNSVILIMVLVQRYTLCQNWANLIFYLQFIVVEL